MTKDTEFAYTPKVYNFTIRYKNQNIKIRAVPLDRYGDNYGYTKVSGNISIPIPERLEKSSLYQIVRRKTMDIRDEESLNDLKAESPDYTEVTAEIRRRFQRIEIAMRLNELRQQKERLFLRRMDLQEELIEALDLDKSLSNLPKSPQRLALLREMGIIT